MTRQKHILITRLSAMGDVAMAVPVVYAFAKQALSEAEGTSQDLKISFLSKSFHRPIVEAIPSVQFIPAEVNTIHKGISGMWKLSRTLKKSGVTQVADVHNVIRTKMLTKFLRLPTAQIDKGRAEKKALTQPKDKDFRQLKTTVQRYLDVFENLGYSDLQPLCLPKPDKVEVINTFTKDCNKKWLGIAPFAAHLGKQYPLELMQEVVKHLDTTGEYSLFLFGAPTEVESLQALSKNCKTTTIVASALSFAEELNLIANLDGMLSMDSGNAHLAAMYGVPTITIWGVTHPYAGFAPFGQEGNCILSDRKEFPLIPTSVYGNIVPDGYKDVMRSIKPQTIIDKIQDQIG